LKLASLLQHDDAATEAEVLLIGNAYMTGLLET
jgi:hypothetical protein